MNDFILKLESLLSPLAEEVCPEGTELKAIVHQWVHALSYDQELFGESSYQGNLGQKVLQLLTVNNVFEYQESFKEAIFSEVPLKPLPNPSFSFIDLFAGIGGMRLATQNQNGICVFSSEFDRFAQQTYLTNFGEKPFGDITKIHAKDIPKHDLLIAGFPCQPFSYAGKCKGFEDQTRGTLFFDVLRIVEEKQPKVILLENVKGFKSHEKGQTMDIALKALDEAGYFCTWKILNSYDFGVPQYRERWFCVATKKSSVFTFPVGTKRGTSLNSIIDLTHNDESLSISAFEKERLSYHFSSNEKRVKHDNSKYAPHTKKGKHGVYSFQKPDGAVRFHVGDVAKTQIQEAFYCCLDTYAPTIIANRTPKLWDIQRKLSVRESARLQGFPEDYSFQVSNAQAYKQLGNSVTVPVISEIIRSLHLSGDI